MNASEVENSQGLRVISYGGGVQSTALVVLAAQGVIDFPVALISNVGDDSEHPATLDYVRNIAVPWAAERGVTIHELHRTKRDGSTETLMQQITKPDQITQLPSVWATMTSMSVLIRRRPRVFRTL